MTKKNNPTYLELQNEQLIPTNVPEHAAITLSVAARQFIDNWIKRYPKEHKRSGIFEALRFVQEENNGHLNVPLMDAVAHYLGLPSIAAYEVAAFYSMYHLNPVGKNVISMCTNISCMLNGAEEIFEHLKARLGVNLHETTPDGKFTLEEAECLGACIAAPACLINKTYYEKLTPEKVDEILDKLK